MDCLDARLLLDFARPLSSELDAPEAEALQQHLSQCPDCNAAAESARRHDAAVGKAMLAVPIPDGLRTRLLARLDRQRDAYYRRLLVRRVLPAAAAVVLIVFGTFYWNQARKPIIDSDGAKQQAIAKFQAPRERVTQWLREVGGQNLEAPPEFDYLHLEDYFLSDLQGYTVPTLLFLNHEGRSARVYVLNRKRFDVQKLEGGLPSGVTHKVQVLSPNDNVAYLVIYTSDKLSSFFERHTPSS